MIDQIGTAAGDIWEVLVKINKPINITDVPKKTNLTAAMAYQGLGWLAREGKVQYEVKGRSVYVKLSA